MKKKHFKLFYLVIDLKNHENSTICSNKSQLADHISIHRNTLNDILEGKSLVYYNHFLIMEKNA